jgi:hypothetical protein
LRSFLKFCRLTGLMRLTTEVITYCLESPSATVVKPYEVLTLSEQARVLAELAKTRLANRYVSPQDFNRARAAQSAALGILGRPVVLANESLLKRIPADAIHSLMADLHLRIRKADNRITVITADGRDWQIKSDGY